MLRGSRPGERRGGRKRETPNRRTVLTDESCRSGQTIPMHRSALLLRLVKDQKLPADTRMAVAPKCFPAKRTQPADAAATVSAASGPRLTRDGAKVDGGIQDLQPATSVPATQDWNPRCSTPSRYRPGCRCGFQGAEKSGAERSQNFSCQKSARRRKSISDEYGFAVNPNLARKYRDIRRGLSSLEGAEPKNPRRCAKDPKIEGASGCDRATAPGAVSEHVRHGASGSRFL